MSDEDLVPKFIPSLVTLLVHAERDKGSALTRDEVESIRDRAVCIMLPASVAARVGEESIDIDPENAWVQWQSIRESLPSPAASVRRQRPRVCSLHSDTQLASLPQDAKDRHEAFIEIFGRQVFAARNEVLEATKALIEAPQAVRDEKGTIYTKEYTAVSQLPAEAQLAALNLSRKAIDAFLRQLLLLLTHNGLSTELSLGSDHAIAYKLLLQVIQKSDLQVVEEHAVNQGGQKVFYEYYGRWLSRHTDA